MNDPPEAQVSAFESAASDALYEIKKHSEICKMYIPSTAAMAEGNPFFAEGLDFEASCTLQRPSKHPVDSAGGPKSLLLAKAGTLSLVIIIKREKHTSGLQPLLLLEQNLKPTKLDFCQLQGRLVVGLSKKQT